MPTRKQRRREAKQKRHEYEFVYVDSEGNEVEELPDGLQNGSAREAQRNGKQPAAKTRATQPQARGRAGRVPQAPSWQRAAKRAALLGIVVFVLFGAMNSKAHNRWISAAVPALIYTALFIPFTYGIDRFAYNRWLSRQQKAGKQPPKRR